MGLFSFVKKAVKGIAKLGGAVVASVADRATGGLSTKALKVIKGRNESRKRAELVDAVFNKTGPPVARMQRTEESEQEGWGFARERRERKQKPKPRAKRGSFWYDPTAPEPDVGPEGAPRAPRRRARMPAAARSGRRRRRRSTGAGRKIRRAPKSFGANALKMQQLAAEWRGLGGREGTGQTFFEWKAGK